MSASAASGSTRAARPRRQAAALVLFVVFLACACRVLLKSAWNGTRLEDGGLLLYPAATLGVNYPEFGFVRRGLGGTLIRWSGLSQLGGTVLFHIVFAALLAAVTCRLVLTMRASSEERAVHVLVFVVALLFWAEDPGRTDVAVAGLLGLVALAVRSGRPVAAAALLLTGLAMHETAIVYGVPLAAVLLADTRGESGPSHRDVSAAAALLACALLAYVFFDRLPHADNASVATAVRSRLPHDKLVDWALYFALGGMRGVRTSICQSWVANPNYALQVCSGLAVIAFAAFILVGSDRQLWSRALLAALPPYVFLCLVANDMARWAMLAVTNVWIVSAARTVPLSGRPRRVASSLVAIAVLLVFTHPRRPFLIPYSVFSPSPLIEALSIRLGGPRTPALDQVLPRCDPNWRDVLDPARHAAPATSSTRQDGAHRAGRA